MVETIFDLNSKLRADAKHDFEKDLNKLIMQYLVQQWNLLKSVWSMN